MDEQGPPAGWYPHPSMGRTVRYWDGARWTDHVAAATNPPATAGSGPSDSLIGIGWVLTILVPLAGFVIGIVVTAKGAVTHGLGMIFGSVVVSTIWMTANGYL